jgi:GT2 family glycosyltransferase
MKSTTHPPHPPLSIVLYITHKEHKRLQQTLLSIHQQTCTQWTLYIVIPNNDFLSTHQLYSVLHNAPEPFNTIISAHPPHAITHETQGKYITYIASGDVLHENFVAHFFRAIRKKPLLRFFYTDHDLLPKATQPSTPHFKPDWNPDYLTSFNYISRAVIFYRDDVLALNALSIKKHQDYFHQLIVAITSHYKKNEIYHFPSVLFSFDKIEKNQSDKRPSFIDYFIIKTTPCNPSCQRATPFDLAKQTSPLVSIIIPTKNQFFLLKQCINSLLSHTAYPLFELLIIDNQSDEPESLVYLEQLAAKDNIQILHYPHPFNYSAINNVAVKQANGSLIALLNNDIEVINSNWLDEMVTHALRPDIGCVGAKLYYPDGTIQHGGVILGIKGTASHAHKYFPKGHTGYYNRLCVVHNVSAVTAACLVMRKKLFEEVGGFDAVNLKVAYNDVDLCLKVMALGYRNLWTPHAELIHYESKSRGKKRSWWQRRKLRKEASFLQKKWGELLLNDPCYNPNLTLDREDFSPKNETN